MVSSGLSSGLVGIRGSRPLDSNFIGSMVYGSKTSKRDFLVLGFGRDAGTGDSVGSSLRDSLS